MVTLECNVKETDLIHEQYFGSAKESPGHAKQLFLPDATPSANFPKESNKEQFIHPVEKLSPSSETGVSKFAKTEVCSAGLIADSGWG